jgi:hypothetical protein
MACIESNRKRLPARRASVTFDIEVNGLTFTATASRYTDGTIGEVFLTSHKAGSSAGVMASDAAIAASLALQFGCPLNILLRALCRDGRGCPASPLGAALGAVAALDAQVAIP